jgi:hypothetical protein
MKAPPAELPQFLRDMLASVPRHGEGVHPWLFKVSRQLHHHRSEDDIFSLLRASVDGCGRHVPDSEITAAIASARACAWTPSGNPAPASQPRKPKWPEPDREKIGALLKNPVGLYDIWDISPTRCTGELDSDWFIDWLFPGDPLICVGSSNDRFKTANRELFRGHMHRASLIVPSPMSSVWGVTKTGRKSQHTLENTGPRWYVVTEFDSGTKDEQSTIIHHLSAFSPLVMVVASGGKSLHGWFNCRDMTEARLHKFFIYAVSLGADPATWTRSQFVRMPEGYRADKDAVQAVFYFDPAKTEGGRHE